VTQRRNGNGEGKSRKANNRKEKRKKVNNTPSYILMARIVVGSYNSQEMGLKGWGVYEQNEPVLMVVAR
jgi:hypothetical protein